MTKDEIMHIIDRSLFADLGFVNAEGVPEIRRVYCVWHKGLRRHLISTNTSSAHVQRLMQHPAACLYFADSEQFAGISLTGKAVIHFEHEYRELLWHDGDEKYYPNGITDPDYCVLEFIADAGSFYRYDGKGTLSAAEMDTYDTGSAFEDGYSKTAEHGK